MTTTPQDPNTDPRKWLSCYAHSHHKWHTTTTLLPNCSYSKALTRPLGLVELSFDADGTVFNGRVDMNALLTLELSHTLPSNEALRKRIATAWASLRLQHVMLMAWTVDSPDTQRGSSSSTPTIPRASKT
ncbi:hypothetical protein CC80DRAFT_490364 [Byssothecium circinans]|uniref:Uncharacterized protein n=1 Tax=Byssothecium circinans TaxID=147558 RepID=A0A6A5U424_9PLEO|nr:hypothetical protein CC80DRAFT_490364 [Byssothecium circinans]